MQAETAFKQCAQLIRCDTGDDTFSLRFSFLVMAGDVGCNLGQDQVSKV